VIRDSNGHDPLREDEWPDEHDVADDAPESIDLAPCPRCGRMLADGASWCPHCREWIIADANAPRTQWWWGIVVAALIALILYLWHGLRL